MLSRCSIYFVLVATLLAGGTSNAEVGVTDTEVLIGAHTNESGFAASPTNRAEEAYFEMINAQGGVNGRKIKFLRRDVQGSIPKTVEATRQLVEQDKVFAMVGSMGPLHMGVYKYLAEKGIPDLLIYDGQSDYDSVKKTAFPLLYSWNFEGKKIAEYIAKKLPKAKVCFLTIKAPSGQEYIKGATDEFNERNKKHGAGISFGPELGVVPGAPQADAEVLKFQEAKCNAVITFDFGPIATNVINFGFRQGFKPLWTLSSYNATNKVLSLLDEGVGEDTISMTSFVREKNLAPDPKGWDTFEALMKKNDLPAAGVTVAGYIMAETFVETLKRAGKDLTRESIVKATESFKNWKCSLCLVPYNTSTTNHRLLDDGYLLINKNKTWNLVK